MSRPTVVFVLFFLAAITTTSHAQAPGTGFPLFNSFAQHDVDTINEGNLNVHLDIPIFAKDGRGLPVNYVISYDTSNWYAVLNPANNIYYWNLGPNWHIASQAVTGYISFDEINYTHACNGNGLVQRINYIYYDPSGGTHSFTNALTTEFDCNGVPHGMSVPASAGDGVGYSLFVDNTLAASITTADGKLIHPLQSARNTAQGGNSASPTLPGMMTDTNGNQLNNLAQADTLGVPALQLNCIGLFQCTTVTYPSPTNPSTFVGATFNYSQMAIQGNFACPGINEGGGGGGYLITSITLADNSHYLFTYEPTPGYPGSTTGRIASVTLPSGAQITYQYTGANNGIICADGSVAGLTRTTPDGTWTYTRSVTQQPPVPYTITSSITTLIDPMGNKQVINFGKDDAYEKMRQIYTGSSTLVKTIETCWSGSPFPCTSTNSGGGPSEKAVREEFPNSSGKVSEVDTFYTQANGATLPTDVWEYDFGSAAPGSLVKHTKTTYAGPLTANIFYDPNNPNTSYSTNIVNRPASVTVYDGSGNTMAQTTYAYDETTPTSTSGIPSHVPVTGSRGNLTTTTQLVQGSTTIHGTKTYYDTGTVSTETDPKGNPPTTYTYGAGSCGGAFPTQVTNAAGFNTLFSYNCNGGVMTGTTDPNNQTTSYSWTDPNYWRLTQITYPDGGQNTATYNTASTPWNIVKTTKINGTLNLTTKTIYDSQARVSQQQLQNDPDNSGNPDYTDTTYDADGRLRSVSNPYRTTSDSTYGTTWHFYDVLDRVTSTIEPDGSVVQTAYDQTSSNTNGTCTTVTDESGTVRKSCSDGLGRLVEVDEPGTGATLATSGSGSITISNSGATCVQVGPNGGYAPQTGTVYVTINGAVSSASWGGPCSGGSETLEPPSAALFASSLASSISGSGVTATANGATINLVANTKGANTNYSISISETWGFSTTQGGQGYTACCNGALTGGSAGTVGTSPLVTLYNYDALGNLICAVQKGTDTTAFTNCASASATWRPRSFTYDSLSRLLTATNPESGTISYAYDANSNLITKTAPKPNPGNTGTISITYSYDLLNRLLNKTYAGGINTTAANYAYDGNTLSCPGPSVPSISGGTSNLIGRRSAMCSNSSASSWSYDPMGRPLVESTNNTTSNINKTVSYAFNFDGSLKTLTNPSGDVVTYTPTGAGRISNVSDAVNNYVAPPATAPMYTAGGLLVGMKNGTAITTQNAYDRRLQPATLSAETTAATFMSLSYNFHLGNGDNGNVFQVVNNLDSTRSATFQYDLLNRLAQANTVTTTGANCWGEVYTIDPWSNLTNRSGPAGMSGCSTELLNTSASTNNRLSGLTYDLAGNVTNDGNGNSPAYDSENRMVTDAGVTYSYDADGNRMEKSSGTLYWYGPGGETLAESNLSGTINEEYIFFNGERLARVDRPSGTVHYYFSDHLGSSSVITDAVGNVQQQYFYYPYGGTVAQIGSDANHYKFTGKERDSESGLDEFGARYYTNALGRFMIPDWATNPIDVPYANFGNPQSLNLYSYVENNPTTLGDPDGHDIWDTIHGAFDAAANDVFGTPRAEGGNSDFKAGQAIGDAATTVAGAQATVDTVAASIGFDVGTGGAGALTVTAQVALAAVPATVTVRAATNLVTDVNQMSLAKMPTGKGSVPPEDRDPKRNYTKGERQEKLDQQNGKCANCGKDKTLDETNGHHKDTRHADGGRTDDANHAAVCKDCHKELHKKQDSGSGGEQPGVH